MVDEAVGEFVKKEDGYYLRIPKEVFEDSMFPFVEGEDVRVSFKVGKTWMFVNRVEP